MPWTTEWRVEVDGVDASNGMRSFLTDISVSDKGGTSSDSCSLKSDDTDGQIKLPKPRAAVDVYLQGVHVFGGFVDSTNWELSRGGGGISIGMIDAPGAQQGVGEEIRRALADYDKGSNKRVAAGIAVARKRGNLRK